MLGRPYFDINTSCRNSTASLFFPDVITRDILTQVLNPPEKVHMEQFLSQSLINLEIFELEGQKMQEVDKVNTHTAIRQA